MKCKKIIVILGLLSGFCGFSFRVGAVSDNTGVRLEVECNLNGVCEPEFGESRANCANDCSVCDRNGVCDDADGENEANCLADCLLSVCDNDGACEAGQGENESNCFSDCVLSASITIPSGSPGQLVLPVIYDIAVTDIASLSARVVWKTDIGSRCQVVYGENSKYASGTVSEVDFTKNHRAALVLLAPGTDYFFKIVCANAGNRTSEVENRKFTTLPLPDILPPANVADFWAEAVGKSIDLRWLNPRDSDFAGVRILRSELFYPVDPWAGEIVYNGKGQFFRDDDLESGKTYYYTAFAYDKSGNYSSGSVAVSGQSGKKTEISEIAAPLEIRKIDLSHFQFRQDGKKIVPRNGEVKVSRYQPFSISIPYEDVPEVLKTIMVTLEKGNKAFSFLLRLNEEKTLYTAILVPPDTGIYPLNITILDYKNRAFKKIGARLDVFRSEQALPVKTYEYLVTEKAPLIIYIIIIFLAAMATRGAYRAGGKYFKKVRNSDLEAN